MKVSSNKMSTNRKIKPNEEIKFSNFELIKTAVGPSTPPTKPRAPVSEVLQIMIKSHVKLKVRRIELTIKAIIVKIFLITS